MDDIDMDELLEKLRNGSYVVDEEGRVLKCGMFGSTPTGIRIDFESGRVEEEGFLGSAPTGFKIDPGSGRVEKEGLFGSTPTGLRIHPESGRIEKEGLFGDTPTGLRIDRETGKIETEGCFITTACVQARGLPDDCTELRELRCFRDQYVRKIPGGAALLSEYYRVAPAIVSRIAKLPDAKRLYERVFEAVLMPVLEHIRHGRNEEALQRLVAEFMRLKQEFVPIRVRETARLLDLTPSGT